MQAYQKAQGEVGSALSRLLAITEAYPDLKANENFKELQAQLEGTENRISVERKRFNDTARAYNTAIRTFPRNLLAGHVRILTNAHILNLRKEPIKHLR